MHIYMILLLDAHADVEARVQEAYQDSYKYNARKSRCAISRAM